MKKKQKKELPFVNMGFVSDGSSPKPGTKVQFRCIRCKTINVGIQPEYARWLAACTECAKIMKDLLG